MSCSEWKEYVLGDVCGYRKEKISIDNVNVNNYISTENMLPDKNGVTVASSIPNTKNVDSYINNDVLISNIRPYFKKIWFANKNGGASSDVLIFYSLNKNILNMKYLYYLLSSDDFFDYVMSTSKGTKMPRGDKDAIMKYKVELPRLEQQEKIVDILSSLDDKIALNNEMNKTLEEMAQSIFKRWFVDFEFPSVDGVPYKSSGGEMVESELGMIPKGWEVKSLDEVTEVTIGKTPPRKEKHCFTLNNEDIKWISIKDLGTTGTYIFETSEYLTRDAIKKYNVKVIPKDTVILSFKLTVGRVSITTENMATNEAIAHFKISNRKNLTTEYLYSYLKNFNYDLLGSTSSIATAVNSKIVKKIPIVIPSEEIIKKFDESISGAFKLIKKNQKENISIKELKNILLEKLMKGEFKL